MISVGNSRVSLICKVFGYAIIVVSLVQKYIPGNLAEFLESQSFKRWPTILNYFVEYTTL